MKNLINQFLKPFDVELHGRSYVKKLQKTGKAKNAFDKQRELVRNSRTIFDVGANRGHVTKLYADLFPKAVIHSFEPFEQFHAVFSGIHGQNRNIRLVKTALSDKTGKREFYLNRSADTNSLLQSTRIGANSDKACQTKGKIEVETTSIDAYCESNDIRQIDILKIDTQGSELAILKGAKSLLESGKVSLIYTEVYFQPQYREQPLFHHIAAYLQDHGYHLEDIYEPYYNEHYLLWCDAIFIPVKK